MSAATARVVEVLREPGKGAMHINDILAKFVTRRYRVARAGRPADLTAPVPSHPCR